MRQNHDLLLAGIIAALAMGSAQAWAFGTKPAAESKDLATKKEDTVWILRSDGGKSCNPETAQSIESGSQELIKAGVRVLNSMKGEDGKMRVQMCGAPTGSLNSYLIPRDSLGKAIALGFQEAPAGGVKPVKKK